jgi:hypothetical protein
VWTCGDNLGDPAAYAPAVSGAGDDRELAIGMRKPVIRAACDTGWSQDVLKCLQDQPAETCRTKLEPAKVKALVDKLAEADALTAKVLAAKKKPAASYECKAVVAAHYSDAAWKGKLADKAPKDRTKAIADSRASMTKACTDEKWSANARACIVTLGGPACFAPTGLSTGRWGFPALAIESKIGVAECDLVLAHMELLARCDKIPQAVRDQYHKAGEQMVQAWKSVAADQRGAIASACKQADDAMVQSASSMGCAI